LIQKYSDKSFSGGDNQTVDRTMDLLSNLADKDIALSESRNISSVA